MKIDTTKIPNFETLPQEVQDAILGMEFADAPDMSQFVSKSAFDKKASEASSLSKQLKAKMTEDELAKAQADEQMAAITAELEQLRAEKTVGQHAAKFLELGYDTKLAQATAKAMFDGEYDVVFSNHAKFLQDREKALRAEILKNTPTPPAGDGTKVVTKEDFSKMSLSEKDEFARTNPERFKELHGGS